MRTDCAGVGTHRGKKLTPVLSAAHRATAALAGFCSLVLAVLAASTTHAHLLTGSIVNYPESEPSYAFSFGDGPHSVTLTWSVNNINRSGFFYRNGKTEVALATGVSSVTQITDADAYSFTTSLSYYIGPVSDAAYTGGLNSFILLKNTTDNFFGVVRLDDIFAYAVPIDHGTYKSYSGLNATWWFQSNGTGNFSPVPEPAAATLIGLGLTALFVRRRTPR
jgi:hypothetical protein